MLLSAGINYTIDRNWNVSFTYCANYALLMF